MYRAVFIIMLLCMIFLLVCCSNNQSEPVPSGGDIINHQFLFAGESANWTGELKTDSNEKFFYKDGTLCYYNYETVQYSVTYKGDLSELASIKKIDISYKSPSGGATKSETLSKPPESKTFNDSGIVSSGGALINKDSKISITVTVDGKPERMELTLQ